MKHAMIFISASRDWMESRFMFEFMRLEQPADWTIASSNLMGHCAADRHNEAFGLVTNFEKLWDLKFDRILFMDTDQYYPKDYLVKMLAHTEPVVAAWNVSRYPPYEMAQYDDVGMKVVGAINYPDYQPVNQEEIKTDIFECDAVGLGASMIDRNLIDIIEPPWFKDLIDDNGLRLLCDDFYFFSKLNAAGYKVTVDRNIMGGHYTVFLVLPTNRAIMQEAQNRWVEYTGQG